MAAFIKVIDEDGKTYYGGNQAWFESNTRARAGCGPVSGANVLLMLARNSHEIANKLNITFENDGSITKSNYVAFMNDVYATMKTWEVPILRKIYDRCKRDNKFFQKVSANNGRSICGYLRGVLKYAKKHGVYLESHALPTAFCSDELGFEFIKEGLKSAEAVCLLTSYNKHSLTLFRGEYDCVNSAYQAQEKMHNHFVTITNYERYTQKVNPTSTCNSSSACNLDSPKTDVIKISVSTWGRIAQIDYHELATTWQSRKAVDSALMYFTIAESPEMTDLCIKRAARTLRTALLHTIFKKHTTL